MLVTLRAAAPSDRRFVESVYFETQRWIIEQLFGWRGDETEHGKFQILCRAYKRDLMRYEEVRP